MDVTTQNSTIRLEERVLLDARFQISHCAALYCAEIAGINHMWNEYFSAYDDWLNDSLCDTMRSDDVVGEFFHVEGRVRDVR